MGAKIQVNADSVTGKHGWRLKKQMLRLMREDLVDFVATDTHDLEQRPPEMQTCVKYLTRKMGEAYCRKVCWEQACQLLGCDMHSKIE